MSERPSPQEVEIARAGLLEITDPKTVGDAFARVDEVDGVVSVLFHCTLDGYPGWHWTVSLAAVDGGGPTVLEAELQPGQGALLAPDWVPWADRLAEYQASQESEAGADDDDADGDSDDDDDPDEDDDEFDDSDEEDDSDEDDDLGDAGDDVYDGVDVDELAPAAQDDDEQRGTDQDPDADGDEHLDADGDAHGSQDDQQDQRG